MIYPRFALAACALLGLLGFSCSKSKITSEPAAPVQAKTAEPNESPSLPPEVEALNAIQKEIEPLTEEEMTALEAKLKAKLNENNLLARLKSEKATAVEKDEGKKMLLRLALIRVERTKREALLKREQRTKAGQ